MINVIDLYDIAKHYTESQRLFDMFDP